MEHCFDWNGIHYHLESDLTEVEKETHVIALKLAAAKIWKDELYDTWVKLLDQYPEQVQLVLLLSLAPNVSRICIEIF